MKGSRALRVVLLLLAFAPAAQALNPALALTQYGHRAWQADASPDGLPQNSVFSIVQARDGYLWLATQEGLARFDGVHFTVFNTRNTPEIRHNDVWKLVEDRDGSLWIATRGGGLARYRDGAFTHFGKDDGLLTDAVTALWQDRDGSLWIGTTGGLNRYKDGKFSAYTTKDGLSTNAVFCLRGDAAGGLWIGTDNGGLNRFKDGAFSHLGTKEGLSNDTVYALQEDRDGSLWVGTNGGLNELRDGRVVRTFHAKDGLSSENIRALYLDRAGSLWIGTDGGGLDRWAGGRFTALTAKQGLSSDSIGALYEDREGSLWIGTDAGGLNQLRDNKFVPLGLPEGLGNENARAILESPDGALWIGTFGGLYRYANGAFTLYGKAQGLASEIVLSLAQTHDGDIWAGTLGGGLARLHGGRFTLYGKAQGLTNDTVLALLEDSHGTLWAGTRSGGLHRLENGRFHAFTTADGLASNDIRYLAEGRDGSLWIGTRGGGLNRYKDGKLSALTTKDGLSSDMVFAIHEDADGVLWIGTFGGGLDRYKDGKFTAFGTKQGLFDDVVFQVLEDGGGRLWLSSNHGVSRVRKQDLNDYADGRITSVTHVAYGAADGMRAAECNGAHQPAGWQGRDGRLWFPTIRGIVTIDPQNIALNTVPPPVVIEQLLVNDRPLAPAAELEVPPGRQKLEFQYTALSYLAPEKVQFRYKLEGFDEDWVEAGTHRSAHYTNLPPRAYVFRVIASNDDGVWNEAGPRQALRLQPLLWQRPEFNIVYVLALLLAGGVGMRLQRGRVRRLQAREQELLRLVSERQQAEDALRAANRALEVRVIDLSREREAPGGKPGPQVTVKPLLEDPDHGSKPEMPRLVQDFNQLLDQLARRERDLQETRDALAVEVAEKTRATEEVESAMKRLQITQSQLVQSEKLASLGSLVAGVAHEINTPVGIGVTAASTLQDWALRLQQQYTEGKLTRADLERFVGIATDSTEILLKNLQRAADLIQSFKQVAVDQASGERRHFEVKTYLDEILLSLAPKLSRTPHAITVECPSGLLIDSYPGALAQILTNFISNSLVHAFPEGRAGKMRIEVLDEPGGLVLRYADDGIGMPADALARIYDPFFTTKRGSGGSGLGMHIVYNLVTQLLGGRIEARSVEGQGTSFEVHFPAEKIPA